VSDIKSQLPSLYLGIIVDGRFGMEKPRPYVTAALLCEKVLQEKDESISLVRIADRLQYRFEGPGITPGLKPAIALQGFVSLKSGPVVGLHRISVVIERPAGDRKEAVSYDMNFLGKDQGQNIILTLGLGIEQDGLYWFDILFDEEILTRIPLTILPVPPNEREPPKS
jgi:hypothetical protein